MKKNLFIAFEGLDGSGKSTQVKLLADKLKQEGHQIYATFEPTDSPIGTMIRNIFNHKMEADHKTIAALFLADRLDHIQNKKNGLLKKMEEGYTVISDRYYFSSYAYHGTHLSMDWVIEANTLCAELLRPDIHVYIDISPETGMQRLNKRRSAVELYETSENLAMVQKKYQEAFDQLKHKENIFITDGNRPSELIAADIWKEISSMDVLTKLS